MGANPYRWYVKGIESFPSDLPSPSMLSGLPLETSINNMLGFKKMKRFISEIQMLLFDLPLNNSRIKNGILPIILDNEKIKELSEYANRKEEISIDLNDEKIAYGNNEIKFKVDPFKKKCLLEGLDDIALSLNKSDKIKNFEENLKSKKPWIFND